MEASFFELFKQFFLFWVPLSPFAAYVFRPAVVSVGECFFAVFGFQGDFCFHFAIVFLGKIAFIHLFHGS